MAMTKYIGTVDLMNPNTIEMLGEAIAVGAAGCTLAALFKKFGVLEMLKTRDEKREAQLLMENEPQGYGFDLARNVQATTIRAKMTGGKAKLWHVRGPWKTIEIPRLERVEMQTPTLEDMTA